MDYVELVGLLAGFLTTVAGLPQLFKIIRTKKTRDISLAYFLISVSGVALWLAYGLMLNSLPLIAANVATLIILGSIVVLKFKYG